MFRIPKTNITFANETHTDIYINIVSHPINPERKLIGIYYNYNNSSIP